MKENYVYPISVKKVEDNLVEFTLIDFPYQVGCCEDDPNDIITSAQELIALNIMDYEDRGAELPKASLDLNDVMYIQVWLPYFRSATKVVYTKKTVTIPSWLDLLAKEKNLNFSAAMVRGIKEELGIPLK
ncbi:MAG: type II toxin-antitoxin system HicB family antitoxin [Lachnospiraceae bacterium]|nr:type II toxin-antitoxin system HicB family antitoxin [Lachnospiraceae bacterium]